jgi:hypothetical protein
MLLGLLTNPKTLIGVSRKVIKSRKFLIDFLEIPMLESEPR